jgi:glutathione peroxidase
MRRRNLLVVLPSALLTMGATSVPEKKAAPAVPMVPAPPVAAQPRQEAPSDGKLSAAIHAEPIAGSLFELSARLLNGKPQPFSAYRGQVVLVVNTASKCRSTPQYEGLEKLYQTYRGRGLVILGFPSNEFKQQEPGSEQEIEQFCRQKYGVTFPMFEKVQTKGPEASPIYRFVAAKHGEPTWNFHKYLVSRSGQVLQAWNRDTPPESPELAAAIDTALNAK